MVRPPEVKYLLIILVSQGVQGGSGGREPSAHLAAICAQHSFAECIVFVGKRIKHGSRQQLTAAYYPAADTIPPAQAVA
ncbi:hypothetical protein ES703_37912 [subsurface metagenome]